MSASITIRRNRLSLCDECGTEVSFNTVKKSEVTLMHIVKLKNIANLLHLGSVQVEEGFPREN